MDPNQKQPTNEVAEGTVSAELNQNQENNAKDIAQEPSNEESQGEVNEGAGDAGEDNVEAP